ncbi:hypothetical protein HDV00_011061 [Rhizophlyctis rosea]|nr:hypothetical protein HDV00_011061 [Rhizophlyctis rosea]
MNYHSDEARTSPNPRSPQRQLHHVQSYDTFGHAVRRRPSVQQLFARESSVSTTTEDQPHPMAMDYDIEKPIVFVDHPPAPNKQRDYASPLIWHGRDRDRAKSHSPSPSAIDVATRPEPTSMFVGEHAPTTTQQTRSPSAVHQLREMERVASQDSSSARAPGGLVGVGGGRKREVVEKKVGGGEQDGEVELEKEDSIEEESAPFSQAEPSSYGSSFVGNGKQKSVVESDQDRNDAQPMNIDGGRDNSSQSNVEMEQQTLGNGVMAGTAGGPAPPISFNGRLPPRTPAVMRMAATPFDSAAIAEFDPLVPIPKDWMMTFESPHPFLSNSSLQPSSGSGLSPAQQHGASRSPVRSSGGDQQPSNGWMAKSPPLSLLDALSNDFVTPNSQVRFSQKDVDEIKGNLTAKFEKEFELAQLEIQDLEAKRAKATEQQKEFQRTLAEWEQAMKVMISERDAEQQRTATEMERLKLQADTYREERDRAVKENEVVLLKYKQLRIDFEDLKESETKLKEEAVGLKEEVGVLEKRYETLKDHAEQKLESANVEIARVRTTYEKEISALKAKLSRSEVAIKTLERTVESKNEENAELAKICDGLVAQLDQSMTG